MEAKTVSFTVPADARGASLARRLVLTARAGLSHSVRRRLALVLSELVTDAVTHGGARPHETMEVRLASRSECVRVEVLDPGTATVMRRKQTVASGGHGMLLVDHLSDGHGRERAPGGGSLAWFELGLDATDHE
jgi:anti-sigma regulatory factor (Ser/Thr protein kinase)